MVYFTRDPLYYVNVDASRGIARQLHGDSRNGEVLTIGITVKGINSLLSFVRHS